MSLSNVALTDTFDTWRTRTNQLVVLTNRLEDGIVDRTNDTSNSNIAAANSVNTTYNYATLIGTSANARAVVIGTSGNAFATLIGTSGNVFATLIGTSGNAYATSVGASDNAFATLVGASANARANVVGASANAYATVIAGAAFNNANSTLVTTSAAFSQANSALSTAQAALVNSSATFAGTLTFATSGNISAPVIARGGAGNTSTGLFFPATRNTIALSANSQYGVFVNTSGNVGIGTTTTSYRLYVSGDIYATGDITAFSDTALKTDVVTISDAVSLVKNLRGVRYTRTDNQQRKVGVIAQEVREVLPEVVVNADNQIGVNYQSMVAVLIEAVKELSAEVEKLKGR